MSYSRTNKILNIGFDDLIRAGLIHLPKDNDIIKFILEFFDSNESALSFSKNENNMFSYTNNEKSLIVEAYFNEEFSLEKTFTDSDMTESVNGSIIGYVTSIQFKFDKDIYRYDTSYPIYLGNKIPNNNGWIIQRNNDYYDIYFGMNYLEKKLELRNYSLFEFNNDISRIIFQQKADGLLLFGL